MKALLCRKCYNIPFLKFMPGLFVKFICCKETLVNHYDLNEKIEDDYTIKCLNYLCKNDCSTFHYLSLGLRCDNCFQIMKSKIKRRSQLNEITYNSIPTTCKIHFSKFKLHDKDSHISYCEECNPNRNFENFDEIVKKYKLGFGEKIKEIDKKKNIVPFYYRPLFDRIIQSYEIYKTKPDINIFLNIINVLTFIDDYYKIIPLCPECKIIYNLNIVFNDNYNDDNENSKVNESDLNNEKTILIEASCKCSKNKYTINEFNEVINSVKCYECEKIFEQKDLVYDNISENILCEKCFQKTNQLDKLHYNEIPYICPIHWNNSECYCENCNSFFCDKCIKYNNITNVHTIKRLGKTNQIENLILNKFNWFQKVTKHGLFNLPIGTKKCAKIKNKKKYQESLNNTLGLDNNSFTSLIINEDNKFN